MKRESSLHKQLDEKKLEKIIELLESAEYNVDNLKRVPIHEMVKAQIREAINLIEKLT